MSYMIAVRRVSHIVAALLALHGAHVPTHAQRTDSASAPEIEVYLVTYGPGRLYWERFGHNAIWIRDPARHIDHMFNYGIFDFNQESFLLRFIQGRMLYTLATQDPQRQFQVYRANNRSIWIQELNLTETQRAALRDFLLWNAAPENRDYRYDYYLDNCSTRVRDAIDQALGSSIRARTEATQTNTTFRYHTQRLTTANVPLYTGLLAGLGSPVDRPISVWEEMFIPMLLRDHLRDVTTLDEDGNEVPLVASEALYYESTAEPPLDAPPRWLVWYLAGGIALAALLVILGQTAAPAARFIWALIAGAWTLLVGFAGVVLAGLWFATDHATSYWNENLFYLTPIALPLAILLPLAVHGVGWVLRPARWLAAVVAVSSLLGWVAQILPGFDQVNGQLIAVVLPVNVAVWVVLWRRAESGEPRAVNIDN
jgi:hypothetical protein